MARRSSKRQPEQQPDPIAAVATNIGGNVSTEILKQHCSAIESAEAGLKRAQQKLKTCWDGAENDGIDKKAFKATMKRLKEDPATARAYLALVQSYSTQLGLFDRIQQWESDEAQGANAASVDRAEAEKPKASANGNGNDTTRSGGALDACRAQGYEAGHQGVSHHDNPYPTGSDKFDAWGDGWKDGNHQRSADFRAGKHDGPEAEEEADAAI